MTEGEPGLRGYENSNQCFAGEVKTAFATGSTIPKMKAMVANSNPEAVTDVADAWEKIYQRLAGSEGSIKSDFDKAVDHVLQHWEGESADAFKARAKKVSKSIEDCSTYAQWTGRAMQNAGAKLREIKPVLDEIETPGTVGSTLDAIGDGWSRDDNAWRKEMSDGQGAQKALDNHGGELSAGKEEQLKAAAAMEQLAVVYSSQTRSMGTWGKQKQYDEGEDYPGPPGGVAPIPVPAGPAHSGPGGGADTPTGRAPSGASGKGGSTSAPIGMRRTPGTETKVDGITGGTASKMGPETAGSGGAGKATVGGGNPANTGSSYTGMVGGATGAGRAGGPGMVGRASGNRGIAGNAAQGAGARSAGSSVRGGIGSGSGAGRNGAGNTPGGRGPLARHRGGKLDTPEAGKGAAKQGGAGLHSSRGGTAAGQRGRADLLGQGGTSGRNNERRSGNNQQGERPDYLVEDEETWMPKRRDISPPTIG